MQFVSISSAETCNNMLLCNLPEIREKIFINGKFSVIVTIYGSTFMVYNCCQTIKVAFHSYNTCAQ